MLYLIDLKLCSFRSRESMYCMNIDPKYLYFSKIKAKVLGKKKCQKLYFHSFS